MLEKCNGLNDPQREQMINVVMDFMEIVKQTNLNPLQLKSIKILNMWWKIFPEQKPWNALKWLCHEGIAVPHSQSGYRACAFARTVKLAAALFSPYFATGSPAGTVQKLRN